MPIVMCTLYAVRFWTSAGSTSVVMMFVTFTTNVIRLPQTGGEEGVAPTRRARTPIRIQTRTWAILGVAGPPPSSIACAVAIRERPRVAFASTTTGTAIRYERPERRKLHCHAANVALELFVPHENGSVIDVLTRIRSESTVKFTLTSWRGPPPETFNQIVYVIVSSRSADRRSAAGGRGGLVAGGGRGPPRPPDAGAPPPAHHTRRATNPMKPLQATGPPLTCKA